MKLKISILLLLFNCLIPTASWAVDEFGKQWIVIKSVPGTNNSDNQQLENLVTDLRHELVQTKYYWVKTSQDQERVLKELSAEEQKAVECGTLDCAVIFGQKMGVEKLIFSKIDHREDTRYLELEMIDIEKGRIIYGKSAPIQSTRDKHQTIRKLIADINQMAGIRGEIKQINAEDIITDFSKADPVEIGTVLSVFQRESQVEDLAALVEITELTDTQSKAKIIQQFHPIKSSDIVRLTDKGSLSITSTPSSAKIKLDGILIGETPKTLNSYDIGTYELTLESGNHTPYRELIEIKGGKETNRHINLESHFANLLITSTPQGAPVYLNTQLVGQTPFNQTIEPGTYQLKIGNDSYVTPVQETITVEANKPFEYKANLIRKKTTALFDSEPNEADVFLNNTYRGKTPLSISDLDTGFHLLKMSQLGIIKEQEIDLKADQTNRFAMSFRPLQKVTPGIIHYAVPGLWQINQSNSMTGWWTAGIAAAGIIGGIVYNNRSNQALDDHKAATTKSEADSHFDDAESFHNTSVIFFAVAGAAYIFNAMNVWQISQELVQADSNGRETRLYATVHF